MLLALTLYLVWIFFFFFLHSQGSFYSDMRIRKRERERERSTPSARTKGPSLPIYCITDRSSRMQTLMHKDACTYSSLSSNSFFQTNLY